MISVYLLLDQEMLTYSAAEIRFYIIMTLFNFETRSFP